MALIVPKLYADLVRETYETKAIMRSLSTDVGILDIHQVGQTIIFPRFKLIGDAEDMTNFTMTTGSLTAEALAQDSSEAIVKQKGKAVYVRDFDNLTALGNHIQEAAIQTGTTLARDVDLSLLTDVINGGVIVPGSSVSVDADMLSLFDIFGDDQDADSFIGFVVHSRYISTIMESRLFIDATTTTAFNGSGIVRNGLLGFYRGIPVYVADRMNDVNPTVNVILLKKGAVGYMEKRAIIVEEERVPLRGGSNIVSNIMYATHFLQGFPHMPGASMLQLS